MKISLITAAALTLVAACAPPSTPPETEAEITKQLGLNGGECLQCAQDALEGPCQAALDACAADLEACLDGGSALQDVAVCIVGECAASCGDDGAGAGPSTDPIDDGAGAGGTTGSGDPGDIPGGLGGTDGGGDDGGGDDTCPPDDGGCGGCDDAGGGCDIDAICDDLLACGEECWFNTADDAEFIDCLINECGATEDLADTCDL